MTAAFCAIYDCEANSIDLLYLFISLQICVSLPS